jgi:cell division initiation protein
MKVTPLDIRRKEFKRSMRGYADEEVDIFLDEVADEFERLFQENAEMHDRLARLEEQLESHAQLKTALEKTLVSAQLQADQMTANARKESQLIMRDAELQARNIVSESYGETQKVQQALIQLKHLEEDFRFKFRSLLEAHLKLLNDAPIAVPAPAVAAAVIAPVVAPAEGAPDVAPSADPADAAASDDIAEGPPPVLEPLAMEPAEPAQEEVATATRLAQTEPKVRWPEDDGQAQVEAEAALAKGEVETETFPPLAAEPVAASTEAPEPMDDLPTLETDVADTVDASDALGAPAAVSEQAVAAASTQIGDEDEPVRGFFFGKQMADVDDSFVTMETPKKDDTRDFEW